MGDLDPNKSNLNFILDKGPHTLTGGIRAAQKLCENSEINLKPEPARQRYNRGWKHHMLDTQPIVCSWTITKQDLNNTLIFSTLDLSNDDALLVDDLDLQQYSQQNFNSTRPQWSRFYDQAINLQIVISSRSRRQVEEKSSYWSDRNKAYCWIALSYSIPFRAATSYNG